MPLVNLSQAQLDQLQQHSDITDVYPLSPMQQGILFHALQTGEHDPYFYQRVFVLRGNLNTAALRQAWQAVVERHPVLRAAYLYEDQPIPLTVIHAHRTVELFEADLRAMTVAERWAKLTTCIERERSKGFDFLAKRGFELSLFQIAEREWWLLWSHHHIALDGWSMGLVLRDVFLAYHGHSLIAAPDYRNYIAHLSKTEPEQALQFWRQTLAGFTTPTPLPLAALISTGDDSRYVEVQRQWSMADIAALQHAAKANGITLNTLLQAAYALLLSRHGGGTDIVFGMTVSGRSSGLTGIDDMAGLFINTLPLRVKLRDSAPLKTWLNELQSQTALLREFEATPLADIQRVSELADGEPLFSAILVVENYPLDAVLREAKQSIQISLLDDEIADDIKSARRGRNHFALSLIVRLEQGLDLTFSGRQALLQPGAMAVLAERYCELLKQLITTEAATVGDIHVKLNNPLTINCPPKPTWDFVIDAWHQAVSRTPFATAVNDSTGSKTFADIDQTATAWALSLVEHGVGPECAVAVLLERSIAWYTALLAILKVGAVYVPLDYRQPAERLRFLLQDSGAVVALTDDKQPIVAVPDLNGLTVLTVTELPEQTTEALPLAKLSPLNAAYRIYTSGSTGKPKGVTISHASLNQYVHGVLTRVSWPEHAVLAMMSTTAADLAHTVVFTALATGQCLHVISPEQAADADFFADTMQKHKVGVLKITPNHLRGLLQAQQAADVLPEHLLILGGEACAWDLVADIQALKPDCQIINHYGPTETTVGVLTEAITELAPNNLPCAAIGQPLPGVGAYVLDNALNLCPDGVPGELYIGGASVARGYHGQTGLTAERFLPNPYQAGNRMYRTGDRVVKVNGSLVWLGRIDEQVKIRGFRVEPHEVTRQLQAMAMIQAAQVIADHNPDDGRISLLAFVVLKAGATVADVRTALTATLPDYLVPAQFIVLPALPLTANGKPDRNALASLAKQHRSNLHEQVIGSEPGARLAPRNALEQQILAIWQTVLKTDALGVTDNFFALGGDSILSLQVIARMRKQGFKLTPKILFDNQTIADLATVLAQEVKPALSTIPRSEVSSLAPLSYGQERLWFLRRLQPDTSNYHIVGGLSITGSLNPHAVEQSFAVLMARHDMLSSVIVEHNGQVQQELLTGLSLPVHYYDLSQEQNPSALAETLSQQDAGRPFALTGLLWRVTLVKLADDAWQIWLTLHHLLADGWSMSLLLHEFNACYAFFSQGESLTLADLPIRYSDYARWQRDWLTAGEAKRQLAYWRQHIANAQSTIPLPYDFPRPSELTGRGDAVAFAFTPRQNAALHSLALSTNTTPFMVLLTLFYSLLYRYSGQAELCVGVPVANRQRLETEPVLGFFINTLVLRTQCHGHLTIAELLAQVKQTVISAQEHPDLPFEHLVEVLKPERHLNRNPLFSVLLNHQKRDSRVLAPVPGLSVSLLQREHPVAQFELSLVTEEDQEGAIRGQFVYSEDLFKRETMTRLCEHFLTLATAALTQPKHVLAECALLSNNELLELQHWNQTTQVYPDALVPEWLSITAAKQPNATALILGHETLSYQAFEQATNRLAHYLRGLGVGPETIVGVMLPRSFELVIALWAVMKAGAAFLPLDPDYPSARLAYMAEDAKIKVLLSHSQLTAWLLTSGIPRINVDTLDLIDQPVMPPRLPRLDACLAYVIYTSGSTGRPKGAGNHHAALRNRLQWMQQAYPLTPADTVLQKTPSSFDVSVWEFFWPFLAGASLCLAEPGAHRDPARIAELMLAHDVTTVHFVPSMLAEFVNQPSLPVLPKLKHVMASGEALSVDLQQRFNQKLPKACLHNLYGPTEAAIDVTHWTCRNDGGLSVPIGQPIANTQIHILDQDLNPVPTGVAGELYIAGIGLARGYQNNPGLTAERFLPNPFQPGTRMYRTGDQALRYSDGILHYLGRLDFQVKLRGQRLELGEIEAALLAQPGINEAAVTVHDGRLIAYVVANRMTLDESALASALRQHLPDYMIPAHIQTLPSLPKTASGKLDRHALPKPDWQTAIYLAPKTPIEQALAAIWQELLGIEQIGLTDNFFALGGHSLLVTRLVARVHEQLGVVLPLRAVFSAETLAELASIITKAQPSNPIEAQLADMSDWLSELEA
ncbi:non-ribosomal peptide synthetase [Methylocucumis oryzae]|uniref:non-ribosomal peptide synthetase n=1 Tax=Methylocucumis oryzae TaxID=1632867 RepID=UPI000698C61C|nr:non-ribosomal peptide synthetase [Methylocucumis oryzae]